MMWRSFTGIMAATSLLQGVLGYGTTVYIAESYCPATTTLATGTVGPTGTPFSTRYLIYVIPQPTPQLPKRDTPFPYIAADGTIASDANTGARYQFDAAGRLSTNGGYISTSGVAAYHNFAPSQVLGAISTLFAISRNNTLSWTNDAFTPHSARFCSFNAIIQVVFNGDFPQGCNPVQLGVIEASKVGNPSSETTTPSVTTASGSATTMNSGIGNSPSSVVIASSLSSSQISDTSASPTPSSYPTPTTTGQPNCFDGSGFDGTVNDDYLILCDTGLPGFDLAEVDATDLADCIDQCNSAPPDSNGTLCVAVEYDILVSDKPCGLKYDVGPVNRGSNPSAQAAIIVNKPYSPDVNFGDVSSSSTSSSMSSTTATVPNIPGTSSQPAVQTSRITTATSVAAQSSAPSTLPPASTSSVAQAASPRPSRSPIATSTQSFPITQSTSPPLSSTTAQAPSSQISLASSSTASSSRIVSSSVIVSVSSSLTLSSTISRSPTSTASGVVIYPTPTVALCPNYNHQIWNVNSDNYYYEIECSTALNGVALVGNSSVATTLNNCIRFCTLYNVALPFQCLGVNYYPNYDAGRINCFLIGSVTGTTCLNSDVNAGRLIYDGYPSVTDTNCMASSTSTTLSSTASTAQATTAVVTSAASTTRGVSSSSSAVVAASSFSTTRSSSALTSPSTTALATSTTRLSTTLSTSTSSASTSGCAPAPTDNTECVPSSPTPLCYSYPLVASNGSSNYEIECATRFSGASLQALLVQSLADCIFWCQYANSLTANSCIGVTYTNGDTIQGGPNNCIRYSSLTCASRGNSTLDSARILGGNYPAIADYTSSFNCPS